MCKNKQFVYANTNHKVTYPSERAEWLEPVILQNTVTEIVNRLYVTKVMFAL